MDGYIEVVQRFWLDLQQGQVAPLGLWSYGLLMVLIVLQGPISTMFGGAAAAAGLLSPLGVLLVAAVGNLSADIFWYNVGFHSKKLWAFPMVRRFTQRHREGVETLQQEMHEQAAKILLLAKLSVGMAVPAIIAAGVARVPWRRWFPVVFTGELIWSSTLLLVGYYATGYIIAAETIIMRVGLVLAVLLLAFAYYALRRVEQNKKS